ncbi:Alpha/Beta hydrolase protein [Halteromyces radiatus]|uniref:Alpha/Beta hydrolase protein n=1 Tax=Halteromyces radiatus TaxID=101107 RepID=UPI002220013B|nr:Alpha/Beta hydrolase protein [Halteromyces radiatus]KAI8088752.1 Alpha/Beta hydrolase protein [Halteromyces radiatus]
MRPFLLLSRRTFTSTRSSSKHISLAYDTYPSKLTQSTTKKSPLIICHGLFGSKQNWASLCRAASQRIDRDIYAVDLRNHGDSPHHPVHDFPAMAEDLLAFMDEHDLKQPILMGHSMGGKAVMMAALQAPERISKVISVDMPPVPLTLSQGFSNYIQGMQQVDQAQCTKQSQADTILQQYESNIGIRMFLLTNLKRQNGVLSFRLPLSILANSLDHIGQFNPPKAVYPHPTLFIAGGKSPYYPPFSQHKTQINTLFPQSEMKVVQDAGHWVHAEKPEQVLQLITTFSQDE